MGLFELQRELAEKAAREAEAAESAVGGLGNDPDGLVEAAWGRVEDAQFVRALYEGAAAESPMIALDLARAKASVRTLWRQGRVDVDDAPALDDGGYAQQPGAREHGCPAAGDGEAIRALVETGGHRRVAPFLASLLDTSDAMSVLQALQVLPCGRCAPLLRALVASGDAPRSTWALMALCASEDPADRAFVAEHAGDHPAAPGSGRRARCCRPSRPCGLQVAIRCKLAMSGDDSQDGWLLEVLREAADSWRHMGEAAIASGRRERIGKPQYDWLLGAVAARKPTGALSDLLVLVHSMDSLKAIEAIGALGDPAAVAQLEAYDRSLCGPVSDTAPRRIAVHHALSALGESPPLHTARYVMHELAPQYGYPKRAPPGIAVSGRHVVQLRLLAAEVLLAHGNEEDRAGLCAWTTAPEARRRDIGQAAWEAVHGAPRNLQWWDTPRVEQLAGDSAALMAGLHSDEAVFAANLLAAILQGSDPTARADAVRWCRARLESTPNHYVSYAKDTGVHYPLIRALRDLDDDDKAQWLADTTSEWIKTLVIEGGKMRSQPVTIPAAEGVSVEAFDTVPFVYGRQINGAALSPDGRRLAVVGDSFGRIVDARSGAVVAPLQLRWRWGQDCAFSPDGDLLAGAYHGGHIDLYDAHSGEVVGELAGHGGVPDGVKRLAFSPDGTRLASCGSDGRVILWDVEQRQALWTHDAGDGAFEWVGFVDGGTQVMASHVKTAGGEKNYLSVFDAASGRETRHAQRNSMWGLCVSPDGQTVAMGGEGKKIHLCAMQAGKLKRVKSLGNAKGHGSKVVRLRFTPDGEAMYAVSAEGFVSRWNVDTGKGELLLEGEGPMWALQLDPEGGRVVAAGTGGTVHFFGVDGKRQTDAGATHTSQVWVIRRLGDGSVLTSGWDGKLLRWPAEGGEAEQIAAFGKRVCSVAPLAGGDRFVVGWSGGVRVVDLTSGEVHAELASRRVNAVAVSADGQTVAAAAGADLCLLDHDLSQTGTVRCAVATIDSIAATPDGGFLVGDEAGLVSLVRDGECCWTRAYHGADKLEEGNPHKNVADLKMCPDGQRFASGATDSTVRVRAYPGGEGELTLWCGFGLFNRLDFSPDGALVVVPSSWLVRLVRVRDGHTVAQLTRGGHFVGDEPTAAAFLDDHHVLVGTTGGRLYRVSIEEGALS